MQLNTIYNEDCLKGMERIADKSIDLILTDLPYGVTDCEWDSVIPFAEMWKQYNRIIKDNGAIVLFSIQPFTTKLIQSNLKNFRYCWYWKKNNKTGFTFAKYQPLRCIEDICVFYKKAPKYNPQGLKRLENPKVRKKEDTGKESVYKAGTLTKAFTQQFTNYPVNLLQFDNEATSNRNRLHPTQKPLALCEYLIKTYTDEGDVVLDSCAGSGTTLLAAKNTGRQYIGFELDTGHYNTAVQRIAA